MIELSALNTMGKARGCRDGLGAGGGVDGEGYRGFALCAVARTDSVELIGVGLGGGKGEELEEKREREWEGEMERGRTEEGDVSGIHSGRRGSTRSA